MGLEDFERELAVEQAKELRPDRKRDRSRHREEDRHGERHRRHHHHRSSRHGESHRDDRRERRRSRDRDHKDRDDRHRSKRVRSESPADKNNEDEDGWVEKEAMAAPPEEDILDQRDVDLKETNLHRDSWMQAPSALGVDYLQRSRVKKSPPSKFVGAKEAHEKRLHQHEIDQLERDLEESGEEVDNDDVKDEPAQHEVTYTFGDSGSQWRMAKLKKTYRQAEETGRSVDDVALERYGDFRDFDDAREEERELERREMYGKDYVGNEKPSGELFEERKLAAGIHRPHASSSDRLDHVIDIKDQGTIIPDPPLVSTALDQTALNKLKARMMKAKLRNDPELASLEAEYNAAISVSTDPSGVVVLSNMENRMLTGGRGGEVKAVTNRRGQERGNVVENEDMSIEDMVKAERRSRGTNRGNEGLLLAESIAKDSKFNDDLEYMDDNANKLATRAAKNDTALRNAAVGDFQKMQKILDSCPLCHHEDRNEPPQAPLVSLGTRTYLTLPTEPELVRYGAVIVPIQHRTNLLECDDDEWEEIRNFQKSLIRFYQSIDKGVIFYENAAEPGRKRHAAMVAVPLSWGLTDGAPGFFKEAILQADEEWAQHRKIIDTAKAARERFGRSAFKRSMVKESPYFHVWFGLDGGLGHIIEDERRWPKGDLFAREIIGGMLDRGPETIKKQGRWTRRDARLEGFRKKWDAFDWTKVLLEGQ